MKKDLAKKQTCDCMSIILVQLISNDSLICIESVHQ